MPNKVERNVKRTQVWARVGLSGASGSGKTRGALELATRLFDGSLPIVLANTEPNRGKLYADRFPLEALIDIEGDYHPERFMEAIDTAEQIAPGGILILDSATHEWYGTNGITQLASRFGDWAKVRPLHQRFIDRLQISRMHIIVCIRAKMKYEQVEIDGRQTVIALGVGPMQDSDFQYEFSLFGQVDRGSHNVDWSGHIDALEGTTSNLVEDGDNVAATLTEWLSKGEPPPPPPEAATQEAVDELLESLRSETKADGRRSFSDEQIEARFETARSLAQGVLTVEYVEKNLALSKDRIAKSATAKTAEQEKLA